MNSIEKVYRLASDASHRLDPNKMRWMWGQALFLFALLSIDQKRNTDEFTEFACRYFDAHIEKHYEIISSDTAAPALAAYLLYLRTGAKKYRQVAIDAVKYMKTSHRVLDYMPNHLGREIFAYLYPKSIWVDSIMMYGVFASLYSFHENDEELMDFAKRQTSLFAKYLKDSNTGLFYHSYWTKFQTHYPIRPIFWGRGNGWVMAAIPQMLDFLSEGNMKKETSAIFENLASSLLPYQREDGHFETLLSLEKASYKENSATALIASGYLFGCRTGLLPDAKYLDAGTKAFDAVVSSIYEDKTGLHLPGVSAPTIPVPLLPRLGYRLTPTGADLTYGLAAAIFAALQADLLMDERGNA